MALAAERSFVMAVKEAKDIIAGRVTTTEVTESQRKIRGFSDKIRGLNDDPYRYHLVMTNIAMENRWP